MKYILSLSLDYHDGRPKYWSWIAWRYTYTSLRKALQAKKDYQRYWDRVFTNDKRTAKVRIEHFYN